MKFRPLLPLVFCMLLMQSGCLSWPLTGGEGTAESFDCQSNRMLGSRHYLQGSNQAALEALLKVIENCPDDLESRFKVAVLQARMGQLPESRDSFLEVIARDETFAKAFYNLGALLAGESAIRDVGRAKLYFKTYLTLEPNGLHQRKVAAWLEQHGALRKEQRAKVHPQETITAQTVELEIDLEEEWLEIPVPGSAPMREIRPEVASPRQTQVSAASIQPAAGSKTTAPEKQISPEIRQQLDRQARELYEKGYISQEFSISQAREFWQEVLKIVPPGSTYYVKAAEALERYER